MIRRTGCDRAWMRWVKRLTDVLRGCTPVATEATDARAGRGVAGYAGSRSRPGRAGCRARGSGRRWRWGWRPGTKISSSAISTGGCIGPRRSGRTTTTCGGEWARSSGRRGTCASGGRRERMQHTSMTQVLAETATNRALSAVLGGERSCDRRGVVDQAGGGAAHRGARDRDVEGDRPGVAGVGAAGRSGAGVGVCGRRSGVRDGGRLRGGDHGRWDRARPGSKRPTTARR